MISSGNEWEVPNICEKAMGSAVLSGDLNHQRHASETVFSILGDEALTAAG